AFGNVTCQLSRPTLRDLGSSHTMYPAITASAASPSERVIHAGSCVTAEELPSGVLCGIVIVQ
ncbi:MAG: hypothetical protein MUQ56_09720, partial [Thermoleophilia bacterium]|nr:hypothetical protein [Thermoleophilia bacterium]